MLEFWLGFGSSIIATLVIMILQFHYSTAGYRVRMVRKATEEITSSNPKKNVSMLRDKYRFSLGVIIDDLDKAFKNGFPENDKWPLLVDNGKKCVPTEENEKKTDDRWDRFIRFVRPVIVDINTYSFIGLFAFTSEIRDLNALTKLCHKLEDTVGELDAAFEKNLVCQQGDFIVVCPDKRSEVESLRTAYREIYDAWCEWLREIKMDADFRDTHGLTSEANHKHHV